jgi:putative transposase
MKKYNLYQRFTANRKPNYTKGYLKGVIRPNYLNRDFNKQVWVTDVTYLIWGNKRAYLSTILDLESRDIISYKISSNNDIELVLDTLNQAINNKNDLNGLILNSDQGSAYLSAQYQNVCSTNGILISMSNKGSPLDNAVIESFHASLKKETLYSHDIKNLKHYIVLVKKWLDNYNTNRIRMIKKK